MREIIQGKKSFIIIRLVQEAHEVRYDPLNLTGCTEIEAVFDKTDGTELVLKLSDDGIQIIDDPLLGKLQVNLTSAQTAELLITDHETLELALWYGVNSDPIGVRIQDAYSVVVSRIV